MRLRSGRDGQIELSTAGEQCMDRLVRAVQRGGAKGCVRISAPVAEEVDEGELVTRLLGY